MIIYLASPYTHSDKAVMRRRYYAVQSMAANFLEAGVHVYAPIAYTHPLSEIAGIDHSWNTWAEFDRKFIEACGELWVAMLAGWQESVGVAAEIEIARALGKPVRYVHPDTLAIWEDPA